MFKEKSTRKVHLNQNNVPGLSEPIIRDLFKPLPWQVFEPVHQQSDYQNLETGIEKGPAHERLLFAQICTGECLIFFLNSNQKVEVTPLCQRSKVPAVILGFFS